MGDRPPRKKERQQFFDQLNVKRRDDIKQGFAVEKHEAWREDRGERKVVEARRSEIMEDNQRWRLQERERVLEERKKKAEAEAKKIAEDEELLRLEIEKFAPKDLDL